ncbi:transglycosylase SLT domain-containing protein [Shewanella yunxiaonensis]|uniref:Transglycosylase SLT domain-containing protein n=1 Tax=Shewanella yunxiaonensis TaxID=2829809 RepID=A0ABX7YUN6_9GAMM|nr:transglycosylase SLT domain-containing protein [Shewanella yunxiaonensis]QUN06417.1 transglycosylase SLT domain-containing protein [Shewanella yunxiaonensis]
MRSIWIFITVLFLPHELMAEEGFAEFKSDYRYQLSQFSKQQVNEYQEFREQYLAEYDAFRQQLMQHWSEPVQSSPRERVIYSKDLQTRIRIDDMAKTVKIEYLTDHLVDKEKILQSLEKDENTAREVQFLSPASMVSSTIPELNSQQPLSKQKLNLIVQIDNQYQQSMAAIDSSEATPQQVKQEKMQLQSETNVRKQKLQSQLDLMNKKSLTYKHIQSQTLLLPNDYDYKKAKPFLKSYQEKVKTYGLSLPLLLAITQTESAYDPHATSHIPAFGLMQIVPASAGVDVAKKIYQIDTPPTANDLYHPKTNIDYGAGYLAILWRQYLGGITDEVSRKYCVIAAYNTGAGNVARVFNSKGSRSLKQAMFEINKLTPQQVYDRLEQRLPYDETKFYLKKVCALDNRYQSAIKNWSL